MCTGANHNHPAFDFDQVIDRANTYAIKYDRIKSKGLPQDTLPLWVADMDFASPPCIIEAIMERCRHGIIGYSEADEAYGEVLGRWFARRLQWDIQPEWIVQTPGVVFAIHTAIRALTRPGESVLIQTPVYYPFAASVKANERKLVTNTLALVDDHYEIDFADFEQKIIDNGVKLFIFCSPHNPVGRVWRRDELMRIGDICLRHGVVVLSDEIHGDFVFPGHTHHVFAGLNSALNDITITCTAPSKTFNIAGLQISNILIANPELRRLFKKELSCAGYSEANLIGLISCMAAYEHGEPWLMALIAYLAETTDMVRAYLREHIPGIRLIEPEGTYLLWLDCRGLGLHEHDLSELMTGKARIWLNNGSMFGYGGEGFWRLNIASPRSIIAEALQRLDRALSR